MDFFNDILVNHAEQVLRKIPLKIKSTKPNTAWLRGTKWSNDHISLCIYFVVFPYPHPMQGFNVSPVPSRQPVMPYLRLQSNISLPSQVPSVLSNSPTFCSPHTQLWFSAHVLSLAWNPLSSPPKFAKLCLSSKHSEVTPSSFKPAAIQMSTTLRSYVWPYGRTSVAGRCSPKGCPNLSIILIPEPVQHAKVHGQRELSLQMELSLPISWP